SALETSQKQNILAAQKVLQAIKEMHVYLTIKAPFDGVITERNVHEGSIVAVESGRTGEPLVRIQDRKKLRLVVAVPESAVS
ncbi:HlyD family efflux transporter periplasmic adaptor subunit, partial [Salmonella enterica]|uniref:HlyD family efflux transporter periplasmic adaptor subunit n=1 Tax=Salmonella enterica TaxID=28901 RepID=UPI003CF78D6B